MTGINPEDARTPNNWLVPRDGGMEGWRDGGVEGWRDGGMHNKIFNYVHPVYY